MLGDGFNGHAGHRVLVEELLPIAREFYSSILLDRARRRLPGDGVRRGRHGHRGPRPRRRPEAIRRVQVDPLLGLNAFHVRVR